jgi:spermidine synthase
VYGTLALAVILNAAIGLVSITASYKWKIPITSQTTVPLAETISEQLDKPAYKGATTAALIIFAVSGFCAMAYEVIWTKLLGLIIGPTTYSFTIVLVTFITVLALGSMVFGWLADRVKSPINLLVYTQILAGLFALFVSHILGNSQFFFAKLIYHFQDNFALLHILKAGTLFLFMFFPTFCLGATFPLVGKIYTRSLSKVGGSIGFAYTINTIGAVLGSFCAGFLLIPFLGKENGLRLVTGVQMLTALVLAGFLLLVNRQRKLGLVPIGALVVLGAVLCLHFPSWNRTALALGKYHRMEDISEDVRGTGWVEALWRGSAVLAKDVWGQLVYYGDGIGGFTTVLKAQDVFGNIDYSLIVSGKSDASSRTDMPTQTLLAHIPMLFHRNPRTVMVLGLASGITAGETLCYPIERLDVLEINPQVVVASRFFDPWNNNVLSNPKTNLIVQDGRAHLQLTRYKYDVVISEPSNPWMAGLATLFTSDFFSLVKDRLNENGIFCQWFHSYQMDWPAFAMVVRTFADVFPNGVLMRTRPQDYLMLGFKGERKLEFANAERNLQFVQRSRNVRLPSAKLLSGLIMTKDLASLCGKGSIHTDAYPRLEFAAPKSMYRDDHTIETNIRATATLQPDTDELVKEMFADIDMQIDFAEFSLSMNYVFRNMIDLPEATDEQKQRFYNLIDAYCAANPVDFSIFKDEELAHRCRSVQIETLKNRMDTLPNKSLACTSLAGLLKGEGKLDEALAYYSDALQIEPDNVVANFSVGQALAEQGKFDQAIVCFEKALKARPNSADIHASLAYPLAQQGKFNEAAKHYTETVRLRPGDTQAYSDLGLALARQDKFEQAITCLKKALQIDKSFTEAYSNLGYVLSRQGKFAEAVDYYNDALQIEPNLPEAHSNLAYALVKLGRLDDAVKHYIEAVRIKPDFAEAHCNLGIVFAKQGNFDQAIAHYQQAVRINPEDAEACSDLGLLLARQGRFAEAVSYLNKALLAKPDFADAHSNLGYVLSLQENFTGAIEHYKQALRFKPDVADVHSNLGFALTRLDRIDEAIEHYKQALRIAPDSAMVHNNLANALVRKGRLDEAITHFEAALRIRPDLLDARAGLEKAQQLLRQAKEKK